MRYVHLSDDQRDLVALSLEKTQTETSRARQQIAMLQGRERQLAMEHQDRVLAILGRNDVSVDPETEKVSVNYDDGTITISTIDEEEPAAETPA